MASLRQRASMLGKKAGHRGVFLLLLGIYDLFFAVYLLAGGPLESKLLIPEQAWGAIWACTGLILLTGVPAQMDRWQFSAAALVKTAWAMEYFREAALGYPWAWLRGSYWLAFALLVLAVAAWPEPQ